VCNTSLGGRKEKRYGKKGKHAMGVKSTLISRERNITFEGGGDHLFEN
jgi:hypothetical protein